MSKMEKIPGPTPITPVTSPEELERIMNSQNIEVEWWARFPDMLTEADITKAIEEGRAVPVPNEGVGYKISAKVPEAFRVLTPDTKKLLDLIAQNWLSKLHSMDMQTKNVFLVVSSLARTTEYQQRLREQGYPAAESSTHTKLGAFDIAVQWFKDNKPELLTVLDEVIETVKKEHSFNIIDEPEVGAYHIALNPETTS